MIEILRDDMYMYPFDKRYLRSAKVLIHHRIQDGYIPSKDGTEIKESLPLNEFVDRLVKHSDKFRGVSIDKGLEIVIEGISHENIDNPLFTKNGTARAFITMLDHEYANIFKSGKCVLPEHSMSFNRHLQSLGYDTYARPWTSTCDTDPRFPVTPDQAYKPSKKEEKEDEEIYYLLT